MFVMKGKEAFDIEHDKENQSNLFLFTENKTHDAAKTANENSKYVTVQIKVIEINLLKIQSQKPLKETSVQESELSEYKRQYNFEIPREKIPKHNILKNNYLPGDNVIEIVLTMNLHLRHIPFETMHLILSLIDNEHQTSVFDSLEVNDSNSLDMFAAACCLGLEEIALKIYEQTIKEKLCLKLLVEILLLSLEYGIQKASQTFYQIFREYWIFHKGLVPKATPTIQKIIDANDGDCLVFKEDEQFHVLDKAQTLFTFSPNIFRKPFENFRKLKYNKFMKPSTRYHVLKILRQRNKEDGVKANYPHRYSMVYDHKDETIISGVRYNEYGPFYFFENLAENEMLYSQNYVGCIEPNILGLTFEIYDDGLDEKYLTSFPKFLCSPRKKIACVYYETNIMGECPRDFKMEFYDFLEKKTSRLGSVKPVFNPRKGRYILNFYGRAKIASARNFILISPEDPDSIILMHGKTSKDSFNLDFRHPLNFIQAFSVCLISIGKKFCVA